MLFPTSGAAALPSQHVAAGVAVVELAAGVAVVELTAVQDETARASVQHTCRCTALQYEAISYDNLEGAAAAS